jgi:uncharacterized protein YndB with AHSA1/START domain
MVKEKFTYTIYIQAAPDAVWNALFDNELVKEYWGRHRNASDWKTGSRWVHQDYDNPKVVDLVGRVVEISPPRKLVVTWSLPQQEGKPDKTSKVTFLVEPYADAARLTVDHSDLEPYSPMLHGVKQGWPAVLSSLKTLLETGHAMPMSRRRMHGPPKK